MPGTALVVVPALTLVGSLDDALESANESALKSGLAASCSADTSDCIWPNADSCVCIVACVACSAVNGCFSTVISWVTIELTSRPLPIPAEEIVPVVWERVVMARAGREAAMSCYRPRGGGLERRPTVARRSAALRRRSALQQLQHELRHLVGLRDHRRAGLLQHLRARQGSRLGCEVGVL